ncbi:MAG: ABC transporter ATP-binding protein, partial [Coprococcus sp.]
HETGDYSPYVGSVFQDPRSQFFTLHVKTELAFPAENLAVPRNLIQKKYRDSVQFFELEKLLDHSIFELSSGEKQKLAVASAYTAGVKLFVLDEPSANMDADGTWQLKNIIKKLKNEGYTIVVSEHKLYYLKDLADRVILLENGKIKEEISGKEFSGKTSSWFKQHGFRQIELSSVKAEKPDRINSFRDIILRAENLTYWYERKTPLWRDVSFEGKKGDIIGIIGSNGAGKSTMMRVLMGLDNPKKGQIFINGKRAGKKKRRQISSYVMQDVDYQLFATTVLDEMLLESNNSEDDRKKAIEILDYFGLSKFKDVHPSMLSGGQKQRLSIAIAYMRDADILFLDEPTSGLDGRNMELVCDAIKTLADKGCLIFIITHDYEFAAKTLRSLLVIKENSVNRISEEIYKPEELYQFYKSKDDSTALEKADDISNIKKRGVEIA